MIVKSLALSLLQHFWVWLWRTPSNCASFSALSLPSKMNLYIVLPPQWWASWYHLSATFFNYVLILRIPSPMYPHSTLFCFLLPCPRSFHISTIEFSFVHLNLFPLLAPLTITHCSEFITHLCFMRFVKLCFKSRDWLSWNECDSDVRWGHPISWNGEHASWLSTHTWWEVQSLSKFVTSQGPHVLLVIFGSYRTLVLTSQHFSYCFAPRWLTCGTVLIFCDPPHPNKNTHTLHLNM